MKARSIAAGFALAGSFYSGNAFAAGDPPSERAELRHEQEAFAEAQAGYRRAVGNIVRRRYGAAAQRIRSARHPDPPPMAPDPATRTYHRAKADLDRGAMDEAATGLLEVLRSDSVSLHDGAAGLLAKILARRKSPLEDVEDPRRLPQTEPWTIEVYDQLALELEEGGKVSQAIALTDRILTKWPLDCRSPIRALRIAELHDQSKTREAARAARVRVPDYSAPSSPWRAACSDESGVATAASRKALRSIAADETNAARAVVERALSESKETARNSALRGAENQYEEAATHWDRLIALDDLANDTPENRYWLADARHMLVVIEVALGRSPSEQHLTLARKAAIAARDAATNPSYKQGAAFFVVDLANQRLTAQRIRLREQIELSGQGTEKVSVVPAPIPADAIALIQARDDYRAEVPDAADISVRVGDGDAPQAVLYAFENAKTYFFYGDFAEAKRRLLPIYEGQCQKNELGYKAFEMLASMAALENDIDRARKLMQKTCTFESPGEPPRTPTAAAYEEAYRAYRAAETMRDGNPEKRRTFRRAAGLYRAALEREPARDEAPEAAVFGAIAYKLAGDYPAAITLYQLFIREYGSDAKLDALGRGDERAHHELDRRLKNLKFARDDLAKALLSTFDYRGAAAHFEAISSNVRYPEDERRDAAKNVVILTSHLGDDARADAAAGAFAKLHPAPEQMAEIEFFRAQRGAVESLEKYHAKYGGKPFAAAFVVRAAHGASRLHERAGEHDKALGWCKRAVAAFDTYRASLGAAARQIDPALTDAASECAFAIVDADIRASLDNRTPYTGSERAIRRSFESAVRLAKDRWLPRLQEVVELGAPKWAVAARARQGALYEAIRDRLRGTTVEPTNEIEKGMIRGYTEAFLWARAFRIDGLAARAAIGRLAHFADALGNARMRTLSTGSMDPIARKPFVYADGMFERAQVGLPPADGSIVGMPLPAAP